MASKPVVRQGDTSSHGGYMVTAGGKPLVNGLRLCVNGDMHVCPLRGHGTTSVTASSTKFSSNGKKVLRVGDVAGCGAVMVTGSPTVEST